MMSKNINLILTRMHDMVGAKFIQTSCVKDEWFNNYWWTEKEENEFKNSLLIMLRENKGFRKDFLKNNYTGKELYEKAVNQFCFNYGWTTLLIQKSKDNGVTGYYINHIEEVLSKSQLKSFNKFMRGQRIMKLNGKQLVYEWDFDIWKDTLKNRKRK